MIQVEQVSKMYQLGPQSYQALKEISLSIKPGEFVAIMGPSGSGKSTLLQIMGGLDLPTTGRIQLDDIEISSLNEKERTLFRRRKLGFVFQNYQLLPTMTVEENISFTLAADRLSKLEMKTRVTKLLEEMNLVGVEKKFPSQLSGGQQQRVAIARALAMRPSILLADEPTGNLDRKNGKEVLELFSRLHTEEKLTIVMVTHDMYAAGFADRVVMIRDGQVEQEIRQKEGKEHVIVENLLAKFNA